MTAMRLSPGPDELDPNVKVDFTFEDVVLLD